jgi:hypothetical protein
MMIKGKDPTKKIFTLVFYDWIFNIHFIIIRKYAWLSKIKCQIGVIKYQWILY